MPATTGPCDGRAMMRRLVLALSLLAAAVSALVVTDTAPALAASPGGCTFTQLTDTTGFTLPYVPSVSESGARIAFTSGKDLTGGNADGNREDVPDGAGRTDHDPADGHHGWQLLVPRRRRRRVPRGVLVVGGARSPPTG